MTAGFPLLISAEADDGVPALSPDPIEAGYPLAITGERPPQAIKITLCRGCNPSPITGFSKVLAGIFPVDIVVTIKAPFVIFGAPVQFIVELPYIVAVDDRAEVCQSAPF
jgi:hypothetical protein